MLANRISLVAALVLAFAGGLALDASDAAAKSVAARKERPVVVKQAAKSRNGHGSKAGAKRGKRRRRGRFVGHGVAPSELRQVPLSRPSGNVLVHSPALNEVVEGNIYNEDGTLNQELLARLDRLFRCRRTGEERAVDPRLYEILSVLHDRFGKRISLNSGFRYQRNEGSRHFHASAMDVSIDGVSYREIYRFAQTLDTGGMGIGQYPKSGFVHIDFRAPGEASYRWTDTRRSGGFDPGKLPARMWKPRAKPNS